MGYFCEIFFLQYPRPEMFNATRKLTIFRICVFGFLIKQIKGVFSGTCHDLLKLRSFVKNTGTTHLLTLVLT